MALCNTISSLLNSCDNNQGGIVEAYIVDQTDVSSYTATESAHTITAIAMSGVAKYATFQFKRGTGNLVSSQAGDLISGTNVWTNTLTLQFNKREAAKSAKIQILSNGQAYLSIIVKDIMNQYTYLDFMQLSASEETTGQAREEGSKYTLTFVGQAEKRPYFVASNIISGLTTTV